ncbi:MAG TPA: PAS domain S-box protein, partial [Rubrobacteraceae bacterium]|nr:PAS domain S-box protein [Rubrobacteraceae bacterium]
YRVVAETASDGIVMIDEDSRILFTNSATGRIFGYPDEELFGQPLTVLMPEYLRRMHEASLRRYIDTGERHLDWDSVELPGLHSSGREIPLEVSFGEFLKDGRHYFTGFIRDITERKRAEGELEESRRALATLMSNLPGMAYRCTHDPHWTMELVSEGSLELTGYPPADLIGNRRRSYGDLIHPADREGVWERVQAGLQEQLPFQINYRIETATGAVKWVWEQGRGVFSTGGELLAVEGFVTDVTERFRSRRLLEQRVASLTRIAADLTVEKPMEDILNVLAASVVEASTGEACSVTLIDEISDAPSMVGSHGLTDGFGEALEVSWRAGAKSPVLSTFHDREARFFRDARRLLLDDPLYAPAHHFLRESPLKAALILPLVTGGRTLGAISVYYPPGSEPTEDERTLLGAVADQAAVVVENARLYEDVRRRVQERSTLLEISNNVASTLELEPLLDVILEQLRSVVDYVDSSLLVVEGDELRVLEYRGPIPREKILGQTFPLGPAMKTMWQDLTRPEPIIIDDILGDEPPARAYRESVGEERLEMDRFRHIRSWLGVPMVLKGRFIGLLAIIHTQPGYYTKRHAELARTVANQAAVAIENARLYERAQGAAALEERQRLARELHDSVSQALYGITLGADAARKLLDRDPDRAAGPVDYILSLAHAGLAEMRALIFELRPESLESEGLVAALEKQAAALRARHEISVRTIILCKEPDVPLETKEVLYR